MEEGVGVSKGRQQVRTLGFSPRHRYHLNVMREIMGRLIQCG